MIAENVTSLAVGFDRQVATLLDKRYPDLAGLSINQFMARLAPLRQHIASLNPDAASGRIPFVIVIQHALIPTQSAMQQVIVKRKSGSVRMFPAQPEDFQPIEGLPIPDSLAYLLIDVDTGRDTLNVTPTDALRTITGAQRFPLTIDEGVALVTHFPEVLSDRQRYNCFSMLGSRRGDKRVPALWISEGSPRLGWCWEGSPHTWLGSASCAARLGS